MTEQRFENGAWEVLTSRYYKPFPKLQLKESAARWCAEMVSFGA